MLGHMQKVNHFWAQIKKTQNGELGRFCPEPFNCRGAWRKALSDFW